MKLAHYTGLSNELFSDISNVSLSRNLWIRISNDGASYQFPEEWNLQLNGCVSLEFGNFVSILPRHHSSQYESASPVKFKVFSCYFINSAVSKHEAN